MPTKLTEKRRLCLTPSQLYPPHLTLCRARHWSSAHLVIEVILHGFFKFYLFPFLERGEGKENERERNIDVQEKHQSIASPWLLTGDPPATQASQTGKLSVRRPALSPLSHTGQSCMFSIRSHTGVFDTYIYMYISSPSFDPPSHPPDTHQNHSQVIQL